MRPTRSSRPPARRPRGVLVPLLAGGVALYVVCLGLFALFHYGDGTRPPAGRMMRDFHAFLGVGPTRARAAPPEVRAAEPPRPAPVKPPPRPTPPVYEPSPVERIAQTLRRIEREAPALKREERDGHFEAARLEVLSDLCDARDVLNEILDEQPSNDRANGLWDRLQELLAAVRKL